MDDAAFVYGLPGSMSVSFSSTLTAAAHSLAGRDRFLQHHLGWPWISLLLASGLLMAGGGDVWFADQLYRWQGGYWALKDNVWTQQLIHQGGRYISVLCAGLLILALLRTYFDSRWQGLRKPLFYVLLTLGLSTGFVALLKSFTAMDCPWHLQRYGGTREWIGLFSARPADYAAVACFPSGHASAGYGWMGLYFVALHLAPQWRKYVLCWVLAVGALFGIAQQLRGAHFLSHDLWTLGISWTVAVLLYRLMFATHGAAIAHKAPWPAFSWQGVRRWQVALSTETVIVLVSLFFALLCNRQFWQQALNTHSGSPLFVLFLLMLLTGLHAFLLGLLLWRWNGKVLLSVLLLTTAFAVHYMNRFNVYLDADMLRNVLATDVREGSELLTFSLLAPLLLYAALPITLLWRVRWLRQSYMRTLLRRFVFLLITAIVTVAGAMLCFQEISALLRNHREIRHLATPINYLAALQKNLLGTRPLHKQAKLPIGLDARALPRAADGRPRLLVLVIGETARAQNWGLNGYARQTTPQLAQAGVINFPDVQACGSSTEVSLPCMFSALGRRNYNERQIRSQQSLLHVLEHAGISTLWRDNQSGCKGVCEGLAVERLHDATVSALCADGRCLDEILLHDLPDKIRQQPGDRVIVLHQLGNHGPAYFLRYPAEFRQFTPTCDSADLGRCERQSIINSYDNALLYTDHFLAQTIATLEAMEQYDSAMIYLSDHGESLGEKGLYLHGMPYTIAPREQLQVPMVMWFSESFAANRRLDLACLNQRAREPYSHDHLFASVLGLMQVQTEVYARDDDLFSPCTDLNSAN